MAQWYYQAVLDKTSLADCIAALQTWANTNLGSIHPYYTKLTVMQGSANQQPFGYLFYYANKLTEDGGKVTYTPAPLPGQGTVASHNSRNADWGWAYRDCNCTAKRPHTRRRYLSTAGGPANKRPESNAFVRCTAGPG